MLFRPLGALYASHVAEGHADLANLDFAIALIVAPLIAFALSALIRLLLRLIISKANAHLITLSYYMRFAVIISMILSTVAIGLNWGGLMSGMSDLIRPSSFIPAFLVTGAAFLIYMERMGRTSRVLDAVFRIFGICRRVGGAVCRCDNALFLNGDHSFIHRPLPCTPFCICTCDGFSGRRSVCTAHSIGRRG